MKRIAFAAFLIGALLLGASSASAGCWSPKASEQRLGKMIDRARVDKGRVRLVLDDDLSKAARVHSKRMARRNTLYHNTSRTIRDLLGGNWRMLGENIGEGRNVRQIHKAFMRSPSHRENVMRRGYRKVGVGIYRHAGRQWTTVLFLEGGPVRSKVGARSC
jgi:uncharacterized protein YkwD